MGSSLWRYRCTRLGSCSLDLSPANLVASSLVKFFDACFRLHVYLSRTRRGRPCLLSIIPHDKQGYNLPFIVGVEAGVLI
jgi:hypothetical protein